MGAFGGLLLLGWSFVLAAFASFGLPGLAHFPAEFQIFLGAFGDCPIAVALTVLGIAITAWLYLRAIQIAFGTGGVVSWWSANESFLARLGKPVSAL
jgi:NADH-quinone oxidoreductase subunit M